MLQLLDVDVSQIGPRGPIVESVRTFVTPEREFTCSCAVHALLLPMLTVDVRDARRGILTSRAKLEARRCAASFALWVQWASGGHSTPRGWTFPLHTEHHYASLPGPLLGLRSSGPETPAPETIMTAAVDPSAAWLSDPASPQAPLPPLLDSLET